MVIVKNLYWKFNYTNSMNTTKPKMQIEIWSDIVCPFCFIGKHRFQTALNKFAYKESIEIVWRSFILNPDLKTNTKINATQHLAEQKGWTLEKTREISEYVATMAKSEGLTMNFDHAIVANSYRAHNLLQFAKTQNKASELKEVLFKAFFTEGKNIDDKEILFQLAVLAGLEKETAAKVLNNSETYADAIESDIQKSRTLKVHGVPFFLINNKFRISGAQDEFVFLQALQKAHQDWIGNSSSYKVVGLA